jgi:hypothetical protein
MINRPQPSKFNTSHLLIKRGFEVNGIGDMAVAEQPSLRIVRGEPTAEELAVITAVMSAAGGDTDETPPPQRGRWNDPALALHRPLTPGPGGWRGSLR